MKPVTYTDIYYTKCNTIDYIFEDSMEDCIEVVFGRVAILVFRR